MASAKQDCKITHVNAKIIFKNKKKKIRRESMSKIG